LPSATAVPIQEENENEDVENPSRMDRQAMMPRKPHWLCLCSPIDMLVGIILVAHAFLGVLICELLAFSFYLVAFILYWIAKIFDPPNVITGILYSFFMALYYGFALGDSVCLFCSVIVTEILAGAGWFVTLLFGGIWMANHRHQYIRRTCHLIRWAFRSPFSEPKRHFSMFCSSDNDVVELPEPTIEAHVVQHTYLPAGGEPGAYPMQGETVAVKESE
jgi:hypothetical protein